MLLPYLDALNSEKRIMLASASVMRKAILEQAGLKNLIISVSGFAEDLPKSDFATSVEYVVKTSEHKIRDKIEELKSSADEAAKVDIVIAADTIISYDDSEVIEKASDEQHAFNMLK